jgi:dihydropteroate synthase
MAHGGALRLGERALVMGILNITPDSFAESAALVSADGRPDVGRAVEAALRLETDGADLLDIGGESTRPGADPLDAAAESARVLPVLRALAGRVRIPVSVDTYKASVAHAALSEGAALINDVSGLQYDPALGRVVAEHGAALVLMHTRGRSKAMYQEAGYGDVVADVASELAEAMARAQAAGVSREALILDSGIGFAKRAEHSYGVLARLPELAALDRPLLAGPSRKSFMRGALGDCPPRERDWGTAAAIAAAVLGGAHIVRVHAVAQMAQVVRVAEELRRWSG